MKLRSISCVLLMVTGACAADSGSVSDEGDVAASQSELRRARGGAVFTNSNESDANHIIAFSRAADGSLSEQMAYATGGQGTGDSLGSQAALALTEDHRFLIAVDAGSNEITSFAVKGAELELVDHIASGGTRPISVTTRRGLVYVVHAGGVNNVTGFALDRHGSLEVLSDADGRLSADDVGPAQIELSPDARELVVTEKTTNKITSFAVGAHGRLSAAHSVDSAGKTPFGFEFTSRGDIVVSEAATMSASSYDVRRRDVTLIDGPISDTQMAPCWVAIDPQDQFAYVANAGSASISTYGIARNGELALLDARGGELGEGGRPLDLAFGAHGRYLYVVDRGNMSVVSFEVADDGELTPLLAAGELSAFASGLVAY